MIKNNATNRLLKIKMGKILLFFSPKVLHNSKQHSIFAPQSRKQPSSVAQSVRASDC